MSEGIGGGTLGGLPAVVENLVAAVEALRADVNTLKSLQSAGATSKERDPAQRPALPTEGEPVDLAELAKWVESLEVRYAAAGDWLRPCALRVAWLAVYDAREFVDARAGLTWHEHAERCRERIRRTISGGGCTYVSHKPDELLTDDTRWSEEKAELTGEHASEAG